MLAGEFCAPGLIAKIGVLFPAQLPTVLETLRPNSVSHVSSIGICLWHIKGARLGQIIFSVNSSEINVLQVSGAAERNLKKRREKEERWPIDLISSAYQPDCLRIYHSRITAKW